LKNEEIYDRIGKDYEKTIFKEKIKGAKKYIVCN